MVFVLSFIRGVSAAIFAISIPFLNIYFFEQGYKMALVGAVTGISAFFGSAMRIPSGVLADKYGAVRVLEAGILMRTLALTAMGFLIVLKADILFFAPFIFMNSAGFAFLVISSNTIVSYYFKDEERPHVLSFIRVGINAGFSIGPLIGGFVSEISYPALFFISGALSFLLITFTKHIKKKYEESGVKERGEPLLNFKGRSSGEKISLNGTATIPNGGIEMTKSSGGAYTFSVVIQEMLSPFTDMRFLPLMVAVFFSSSLVSQFISNFPVFAKSVGIENRKIGYFFTINGVSVVLFQVLITKLASRYIGRYRSVFLGIIIYTLFLNLFGINHGFLWYAFCVFGLTLGEMLFLPFLMSLAMESAPEGRKGTYLGVYEFMEAAGWSFGRFFGGAMFDAFRHSPQFFWLSVSLGAPLSLVSVAIFSQKSHQSELKRPHSSDH